MRKILLIGGGGPLQPRLRRSGENVSTTVLCSVTAFLHVYDSHENEKTVILRDDAPPQQWISMARYLNGETPFDAVWSLSEIDQDKAAAIGEDLRLSFHSSTTVFSVQDKIAMRNTLNFAGVENLPFSRVGNLDRLEEFYRQVGPPLLLKPSRGRGSIGISVIRSGEGLESAFNRTSTARARLFEPSPVLAERYVEGPEFSVEAFSHRGVHYVLAITEKLNDDATKVETGHIVPARIPHSTAGALISHVRKCLSALRVKQGITHSEIIMGTEGPVLVETHLRPGGGPIMQLVETAAGVDPIELLMRHILGEDMASRPELAARLDGPIYRGASAVIFLPPPRFAGRLDRIDGLDDARALEGVLRVEQRVADGTELNGVLTMPSRLASARVAAQDPETAVRLAEEALAKLTVRFDPAPGAMA